MTHKLDWDDATKAKGPTPPPWTVSPGNSADIYIQIGKYRYGPVWDGLGNSSEMVANARLIAAAPAMLEALEALYNSVDSCVELTPQVMHKAQDAIAKAKGD